MTPPTITASTKQRVTRVAATGGLRLSGRVEWITSALARRGSSSCQLPRSAPTGGDVVIEAGSCCFQPENVFVAIWVPHSCQRCCHACTWQQVVGVPTIAVSLGADDHPTTAGQRRPWVVKRRWHRDADVGRTRRQRRIPRTRCSPLAGHHACRSASAGYSSPRDASSSSTWNTSMRTSRDLLPS